jgi:hypothetical protein
MAYDYPYRIEINTRQDRTMYEIERNGEGVICSGEKFAEMRKLVDIANKFYQIGSQKWDEDASYLGR